MQHMVMHGREMMSWLTHIQHIRSKERIFVGILDEITDDYGRKQYLLQIEGSKTGRELPGIVDEGNHNVSLNRGSRSVSCLCLSTSERMGLSSQRPFWQTRHT